MDYGEERSEKYGHSRFGHTYHQGFVCLSISIRLTAKLYDDCSLKHLDLMFLWLMLQVTIQLGIASILYIL